MLLKFITSKKFYLPIIYIIVGIIVYFVIANMIDKFSKFKLKKDNKVLDKRKDTIISLIKNVIKYIIGIITIIMILNVYGVNTTSIIASLGAVTVIIGLAFQDIIKDFLAGIFIVFDNAYAVGDWVTINGFNGEVISLGLKTTKIRSYTGEVKILSNSSFNEVVNYNMCHSKIIINIPVSYSINIDKLEDVLNLVREEIVQEKDVYNMELLGVDEFGDSSILYSVVVECVPMTQITIKRKVLKLIKKIFDEKKIVIPFNQLDVHIEK